MALPPNPHVAFVWLTINNTSVTVDDATGKPRHLESFSCTMRIGGMGTFEIVLFDPEYDVVERLVAESKGVCELWWGYTTGEQSQHYSGKILEYVPDFLLDGIRVTLRGQMYALLMLEKIREREWHGDLISEYVKNIVADYPDFEVDAYETAPVLFREDCETTDLIDKTFQQKQSDWSFIEDVLAPLAVTTDTKQGGYLLYFEAHKKKVHFHPPGKCDAPPERKTYVWRDKLTEIIRFTPHYNGNMLAYTLFGGSTAALVTNAENKTLQPVIKSDSKKIEDDSAAPVDGTNVETSEPASETPEEPTSRTMHDWWDKEMAGNEAKYHWYHAAYMSAFSGELVVVGDPTLLPFGEVEIIVQKKDGGKHWTSGIFNSRAMTHAISGDGTYTTTFGIFRSGSKDGETTSETIA